MLNTTTFRASGAIKSLVYGNGRQLTMGYNPERQQPISMKADRVGNPADKIIDYSYEYYDANGKNNNRIRSITDNVDSPFTVNYLYDDYNRLTSATAGFYFRYYYYDAFGNITNFSAAAQNYALNATGAPATNRILNVNGGAAFSYDNAGNLTAGEGQSYAYDGASRLSSVNGGAAGQYGYDGDGARVKKLESGATMFYVRSSKLGQVAFEVTGAGVQRAYVYVGGKAIAQLSIDGQFYWVHLNHINSARAMTDVSGNLVYRAQFDPHGQPLTEWAATGNTNLNLKKFTGYERDAATGLDYAEARTYTANRGRFMQPDPMGSKDAGRPQSLNRYSYVENDPINHTDPTGKFLSPCETRWWEIWFSGFMPPPGMCDDWFGALREEFSKAGPGGAGGGGDPTPVPPRLRVTSPNLISGASGGRCGEAALQTTWQLEGGYQRDYSGAIIQKVTTVQKVNGVESLKVYYEAWEVTATGLIGPDPFDFLSHPFTPNTEGNWKRTGAAVYVPGYVIKPGEWNGTNEEAGQLPNRDDFLQWNAIGIGAVTHYLDISWNCTNSDQGRNAIDYSPKR